MLQRFLQSTNEADVTTAGWNREKLEFDFAGFEKDEGKG